MTVLLDSRVILCIWMSITYCSSIELSFLNGTVCQGTSQGFTARGKSEFRYNKLRSQYTNCTYVEGNLEIKFLEDNTLSYDLSFLNQIKEVTGYVLIIGVYVDYIPLENLRIIRGRNLLKGLYSLYVAFNSHHGVKHGIRELRFKSLSEILRGKVFFFNNQHLCYEHTINWKDINPGENPPVEFNYDLNVTRRECPDCHESCFQESTGQRSCWGQGPNMCQRLSHGAVCHGSCDGRCYGKLPNQCCHPQCAGYCEGPKKTDCLACRNFNDNGACVPYCPPLEIYDAKTYRKVPNPDAKYTYGSLCVEKCPHGMLVVDGSCVVECPTGMVEDGVQCVRCNGPCPRVCKGTENKKWLTSENIESFTDCTKIQGTLSILKTTFEWDHHNNIPPLHPANLSVFEYVKQITGNLIIQSNHSEFRNLSYFRSLENISGRDITEDGISLSILMTQLESLELTNLKKIQRGNVLIAGNNKLCYANTMNWSRLMGNRDQKVTVVQNADNATCFKKGAICDPECSDDGCWGKGPNKCLECRNFKVADQSLCVHSCESEHVKLHYTAENNICRPCHPQCKNKCTSDEPSHCDSCLNVGILDNSNNTICLEECPSKMYPDAKNMCQNCHPNCGDGGCTGDSAVVGDGGCNTCEVGFQKSSNSDMIVCLPTDTNSCQDGYHMTPVNIEGSRLRGKRMCVPCHRLCETCTGASNIHCIKCKYFSYDDSCVEQCPTLTYGHVYYRTCESCHQECREGCDGSLSTDCLACKNFKIYLDDQKKKFNCTKVCPDLYPYSVLDDRESDTASRTVCADDTHPEVIALMRKSVEEEKKKMAIIVGPSVAGLLILGVLIACIAWWCQKQAKAKEKTAKLTAKMTGWDEEVPLTPTAAKPDLAQLRLIKECDLRRGGIIGSGAFGTVYKGLWIPEGENVKIPVAIKVLQEGTSPNQNKELLEEARVMSSVEHPCCVRILAVCMTAQMMLITQLMPLGCLLDYVRKNREHIGSKTLLNWCTQIARGMVYLEDRGIVHRDLAARNVLLHTPLQIKITDFGLAKLLDFDEEVYQAAGGKMPIKWLALECIQHRIFTHKSDVWSYGVTVWELMTYGQKPYDNIRARDVPDLLEKGERLPQPHYCTIDVYMIMIKCWMLDAESRPSFLELQEEFNKMARDPGRYLVIPGDKLMRLPSVTYDKNDLMRCMSIGNEGPEEVMEADAYLQPNLNSRDNHQDNNNAQVKVPLLSRIDGADVLDGKGAGPATKPKREKHYAHLQNAVQARQQRGRGDSVHSRYSTDPVQILKDREDSELSQPMLNSNGEPFVNLSYKNEVPLKLPVDEDDYLQPKSQIPAAYMDLSDKGYYQNERDVFDEAEEDVENGVEEDTIKTSAPAIDNPEYFDTRRANVINSPPGDHAGNKNYYNDIDQISNKGKKLLISKVDTNEEGCETSI